jgi:predicted ATPase with chaperone activity
MKAAMRQVQLTAEASHRVLKLSQTIADQDETVVISQIY